MAFVISAVHDPRRLITELPDGLPRSVLYLSLTFATWLATRRRPLCPINGNERTLRLCELEEQILLVRRIYPSAFMFCYLVFRRNSMTLPSETQPLSSLSFSLID